MASTGIKFIYMQWFGKPKYQRKNLIGNEEINVDPALMQTEISVAAYA